jgi:hypothetical protein
MVYMKTGVVACGVQNFFAKSIRVSKRPTSRSTKEMTIKLGNVLAVWRFM